MRKTFDMKEIAKAPYLTSGFSTSIGIATGRIVFSKEMSYVLNKQGEKVILVKKETEPSDIGAIKISEGVLTTHGNIASNATVASKVLGKTSIIAPSIHIDNNQMIINDISYKEGTVISLDGYSGKIYLGYVPTIDNLSWKDKHKQEMKENVKKYIA